MAIALFSQTDSCKFLQRQFKHHLKQVDDGINKIEEGILEVIYTVDEIIERYENGEIFREDCHEAINKLFIIADFTRKIENEDYFRRYQDF